MEIKTLTPIFSVCAQIKHRDISGIARLGFKTIINNRPDREAPFQPRTKTLAVRAENAGLNHFDLPVIPGNMTQDIVDDFKRLMAGAEGPILAFCRTGTRSANLWARTNSDDLSAAELTRIGAQAGYKL